MHQQHFPGVVHSVQCLLSLQPETNPSHLHALLVSYRNNSAVLPCKYHQTQHIEERKDAHICVYMQHEIKRVQVQLHLHDLSTFLQPRNNCRAHPLQFPCLLCPQKTYTFLAISCFWRHQYEGERPVGKMHRQMHTFTAVGAHANRTKESSHHLIKVL